MPARRRVAAAESQKLLGRRLGAELERVGIEIAIAQNVEPNRQCGRQRVPLDFTVDCAPEERAVTILRHPSGATTFHTSLAANLPTRARDFKTASLHFRIELVQRVPLRNGSLGATIKMFVLKVNKKLIDAAVSAGLPAIALKAEELWWRQRKLAEGWHKISGAAGGIQLTKAKPGDLASQRALLFLHGTFSDTVGSFGALLQPQVLAALHERYAGRVFGFEHFSVSRSPAENARALLEFLPDREHCFDVVSYSRGGLVLRTLAEQSEDFGALGRRFQLNCGILVAVPNSGTPLATRRRWEVTFGLLATLLELLPTSLLTPLTTAAAFIAHGLVWLAGHITGDLPGLEAMDADSSTIARLQQCAGAPRANYSAIGANCHPPPNVWQRLLDIGVGGFFAGANDLVVPSAGALAVAPSTPRVIPAARVACFGPGGNLRAHAADVHHLSILARDETAAFILQALRGESQNLPAIDLDKPIPSRKHRRDGVGDFARPAAASREAPHSSAAPTTFGLASNHDDREGDRTLQLLIINDPTAKNGETPDGPPPAQIIAIYGSARVVESFSVRDVVGKTGAGTRFQQIIDLDERIQMNLDGRVSKKALRVPDLPDDESLRQFGTLLFEALFTPRVRRLYDLARSEQRGRPLNVVFTCTIPWVASKPWEFCFDPSRQKFLATEEIHFVRNVLTGVPAQRLKARRDKLRLLVVEAQPAGTLELALEEEERQIRFRFQPLIDAGLVEINVLTQATTQRLHERIVSRNLEGRPYDVVHFIGHGEFDRADSRGRLLFQDQAVDTQTLRELLCNRGLQLVFLNACDTARDARKTLNRGVAAALVEGGLPAVVANQYKVLDPSAVTFAQHFYGSLAHGATLGEAAREARIAVNYSIDGEIIDWAVPVLYARDPDHRLCVRKAAAESLKRKVPRVRPGMGVSKMQAKRRLAPITVGIADLPRAFTGLEEILVRLNEVQPRFVFRLVEINTPMGVWEHDPKQRINYLCAERFAAKLKDKPKALGVDLLICITNCWLRAAESPRLHHWRSGVANLPVLIISTAGLALPMHGPVAGRVVANELVGGIGAQIAESNANVNPMHNRGPKDCPFYHSATRNIANVAGRLRIAKGCRAVLMKALPPDLNPELMLTAFDELLAAFDAEFGKVPKTAKLAARADRAFHAPPRSGT